VDTTHRLRKRDKQPARGAECNRCRLACLSACLICTQLGTTTTPAPIHLHTPKGGCALAYRHTHTGISYASRAAPACVTHSVWHQACQHQHLASGISSETATKGSVEPQAGQGMGSQATPQCAIPQTACQRSHPAQHTQSRAHTARGLLQDSCSDLCHPHPAHPAEQHTCCATTLPCREPHSSSRQQATPQHTHPL
jgi:hypothetical protein